MLFAFSLDPGPWPPLRCRWVVGGRSPEGSPSTVTRALWPVPVAALASPEATFGWSLPDGLPASRPAPFGYRPPWISSWHGIRITGKTRLMGLLSAHELSPCTPLSLLVSAPEKAQAENSDEGNGPNGRHRPCTGFIGGNPESCVSPRASPQILGE